MPDDDPAILGGDPVSPDDWPERNTVGKEEKQALIEVAESGTLSGFRAASDEEFHGGPQVKGLADDFRDYFDADHAVPFNSLTSGLFAAVAALNVGPGDEVIVPPYTMASTATAAVVNGAVPVFADIDPETHCLDPQSVRGRVTPRTQAVIPVHLFGHPADMDAIMEIADDHDLGVIEDCAQAPAGRYKGELVGTIGDVGGFSLNRHKTIQCGEGGVMITDDADLALRMKLKRNHGEVLVEDFGVTDVINTFGGNTRMTEMAGAVGRAQLRKLDDLTERRVRLARHLDEGLEDVDGITPHTLDHPESKHVYYFYPMRYDAETVGLPRERFVEAVRAEGIHLRQGYVEPLYRLPMFRERAAFKGGFPWSADAYDGEVSYEDGICPNCEAAYEKELLFGKFCRHPLTEEHADQVVRAFEKVVENADRIRAA